MSYPHRNPHQAPGSWFGRTVHATAMSTGGLIGAREQNAWNGNVKRHLDELWSEAFQAGAAYYASIEAMSPFLVVTAEQRDAMLETVAAQEEERQASDLPRLDQIPPAVRERMSAYNQRMINRVNAEELATLRARVAMLEGAMAAAADDLTGLADRGDTQPLDARNIASVLRIIKDRK